MAEVDYESGPETKELNIKIFELFYLPEDLYSYEELLETIDSLILTKKDAENVFGQIFEFLVDEDLDMLKVKKAFLLSKTVLNNPVKGFKIYETVIANNSSQFDEFVDRNENLLSEEQEIVNIYESLKKTIEKNNERINGRSIKKPRTSIYVKKSIEKMGQDLSQLLKEVDELDQDKRKSIILGKIKFEYDKQNLNEQENKNSSEANFNELNENVDLNVDFGLSPIKSNIPSETLETSFTLETHEKKERQSLFDTKIENIMKIENTPNTNSLGLKHTTSNLSNISNLNTKALIEDTFYKEEAETENENILYFINKTTNEKEVSYIRLNLLMKYIISEEAEEKFKYEVSRCFLTQHGGIISTDNLIELLNSLIVDSGNKISNGLIEFLNIWLIYLYKEQLHENVGLRVKIIRLYEKIESFMSEIIFNKTNKVKISEIKEILRSDDLEFCLNKIQKISNSPKSDIHYLNFYSENPIMPSLHKDKFDILDWSEIEIARQLTLVTFYFFSNIQFKELMNSQWTKVNKSVNSPNVTRMIERFNKLTMWVCEEILSYDKAKYRAMAIEKFIKVAYELKKMNNLNDCFIIITALNSFNIKCLHKTWRRISFEEVKITKELNALCSYIGNYAALREEIQKAEGSPCIPYLGFFLKELAFIDEGPKYTKDPNLVNVDKIRRVSKSFDSVKKHQNMSYNFKPVFKLGFLADVCSLKEEELTELSSKLEPTFTLSKSKNKLKRPTTTDMKCKHISLVFNEFINSLHKNKKSKVLRDQIELFFNK